MTTAKGSIIVRQAPKDGDIGAPGVSGQSIRLVKWIAGETYHNDADTVPSPRYLDILLIFNDSGVVSARYQCTTTYTSVPTELPPSGDGNANWTKVNNMGALYTPVFMADNGDITFLTSNQILIKKADGTITAGISGEGTGSAGYRFWAGPGNSGEWPFSVDELGHVKASDAEIGGELKGVTGSFKELDCINNSGSVVGRILFGNEGTITIEGDMYVRNYGSQRGNLSSRRLTCETLNSMSHSVLLILGSYGYYYPDGLDDTRLYVSGFSYVTVSGNTVYYIPLDTFPAEIVLLKTTSTYRYILNAAGGKEVMVANINNNQDNYIYSQGSAISFNGGAMAICLNVGDLYTPSLSSDTAGAGWLIGAFRDNNW